MDISRNNAKRQAKNLSTAVGFVIGIGTALNTHAELTLIDDTAMAEVTGQAGLTIDMELKVNLAEIAYRDGGFLAIEDFAWGGADRTGKTAVTGAFENWRMVIDVAGDSESLAYGFSELDQLHKTVISPDSDWSNALSSNDDEQIHSDGNLAIHITSTQLFDGTGYDQNNDTDFTLAGGATTLPSNSFSNTIEDWRNSAPFGIKVGAVKLRSSTYKVGSKTNDGTTLMSNFIAEVLTGPLDIVIQNNGDGSTNGVPDSKIMVSDYFEISDLSVDIDLLATSISGFRLHNRRGDTTGLNTNNGADNIAGTSDDVATESFGFAHAKWYIAAAPLASDGLQLAGAIKGDIDIDRIAIGGKSIGAMYITDLTIESSMKIRGH